MIWKIHGLTTRVEILEVLPMKDPATHLNGFPLVPPRIVPVLDAQFRPAALANRAFRKGAAGAAVPVRIAVERADGCVSRFDTVVADLRSPLASGNFGYIERLVKFLLWSRGGWRVYFGGPDDL